MSTNTETTKRGINNTAGKWLGCIEIVVSVIGFFWAHIWMGIIGAVCGVIGLFSPKKWLNGIAVAAGIIALIIGLV